MITLFFWYALDVVFHRWLGWDVRYIWVYKICGKLTDACERHDRWDLW